MILHYHVSGHDQDEIESKAKAMIGTFFNRIDVQDHDNPYTHVVIQVYPNYKEYNSIGSTYEQQNGWKADVVAGPYKQLRAQGYIIEEVRINR